MNPLYFCGFSRVGCIGCPMAGKHRYFEFARYPQYEKLYLMAFDRMLEEKGAGAKGLMAVGARVYRRRSFSLVDGG